MSSSCRAFASNKNVADGVAVVGCGVLGTSLCKQLLESPHFSGNTGEWFWAGRVCVCVCVCLCVSVSLMLIQISSDGYHQDNKSS